MRQKEIFFFLLDQNNSWIEKYLNNFLKIFPKKYNYKITKNLVGIKNKNVFVLSYTKILPKSFLKKNKRVLIVHPSKLPYDRGFAPVQNQILRSKNKIHISLIEAVEKVDLGPIIYRDVFLLSGDELSDEIREKQAIAIYKIILKFLKKYPNIKTYNQKGIGTFNKRRKQKDCKLNISKSIKSQFNLLRICDNNLYPAFFKYKKNTYVIKIYKINK